MNDMITVTGLVAGKPRYMTTHDGVQVVSLRLASQRSEDGAAATTTWYTVFVIGEAAPGVAESIRKGDRVVVSGTLRIREWGDEAHSGTSVELTAEAIGIDLMFAGTGPRRGRS